MPMGADKLMCISCGGVFTEEEAEEHKEGNDCGSIDMVITGP